ncbi:UNVERIFIED_ORG: pyrroline-5-carboxylate reductase [Bradyrhizobium japonicum]|jgi:pyrroline-5-carboxylate reductase|uniref:hypothetical protein n=1 Tax=Bradyrhizobium TaxID=374 RepID=UPI00347D292C
MVHDLQVGLIGAGRLGQAIGRSVEDIWGRHLPVWSRRFAWTEAVGEEADGCAVDINYPGLSSAPLPRVMNQDILLCAIPNWALTDIARVHSKPFQSFSGVVLLAGADTPPKALAALLPYGTLVRIVPIILPGRSEFVFFAYEPGGANQALSNGLAFLNALGSVITVQDDRQYNELTILTSPFATVIRTALRTAIAVFLDSRQENPKWQRVAESVTALSLSGHDFPIGHSGGVDRIATPGGITEAGLSESRFLVQGLLAVMHAMRKRADALGSPVAETGAEAG